MPTPRAVTNQPRAFGDQSTPAPPRGSLSLSLSLNLFCEPYFFVSIKSLVVKAERLIDFAPLLRTAVSHSTSDCFSLVLVRYLGWYYEYLHRLLL